LKLLIDKLNWEITELCFLKENYSNKIQSLNDWEKHLRDKQTDLSIQETQITSKKALMEKDLELLSHQRKNLHQEFQENRRKQEILKKTLQDMQSTSSFFKPERLEKKSIIEGIILKPRRSEPTSELDNEISSLEKEINSLESSEFCHSPRSDQIKTRLDRLKTKLSSLKSKRVINASLERSNSANKLHLFDLETKKLSHSRSSFRGEPLNSSSVFNSNKGKKENSPKKTEKTMGSTEELQKYLKLRENRLNEKEEDLSKRENFIFNNLGKLQDNIGLVSIVQNEHRNLKILRNDLEKRQKCLEQQVFNYSRKFSEVKAREKEILASVEKFECFLKQKKQIEDQLVFLASLFEEC
jgi:chromosome segregation ATPase